MFKFLKSKKTKDWFVGIFSFYYILAIGVGSMHILDNIIGFTMASFFSTLFCTVVFLQYLTIISRSEKKYF
jgi:hypothetical protein